jgi:hypothetical protein
MHIPRGNPLAGETAEGGNAARWSIRSLTGSQLGKGGYSTEVVG